MADDLNEAEPAGAEAPEGVFGNLPSTRPGARSPRRRRSDSSGEARAGTAPESPETDPAPSTPKPEAPTSDTATSESLNEPEVPDPLDDPLAPQPGIHGVEDLAWAGVAVAAQAATAGIRFTSRALEAARKSIDRP